MSDNECEYDSTWEDEHENKTPRKKIYSKMNDRNTFAARDMQNFRHSCQGLDDDAAAADDDDNDEGHFYNLQFYRGQIKSSPDNVHIDDFHQKWWGKYQKLQDVHSYTQWLFPIQEPGVNWRAYVLKKKEIKLFRNDEKVKKKLVKSYELMLDFYGIRLVDKSTGEVERAPNWEDRFRNLNRHTNNNLRITRILKCLGTLGLKHYQAPLVRFFLRETLVNERLPNVKQSVLDYFMFAVLDKLERRELVKYAFENFKPQKHFVWGPKKILSAQVVQQTKEKSPCQGSETEKMDVDEESEDKQNRVKPCESKDEVNIIDPNHNSEEIESKKDHQNKEKEPVVPSNSGSRQTEEKCPCQGSGTDMSLGVGDNDDVCSPHQTKESHEMSEMSQ